MSKKKLEAKEPALRYVPKSVSVHSTKSQRPVMAEIFRFQQYYNYIVSDLGEIGEKQVALKQMRNISNRLSTRNLMSKQIRKITTPGIKLNSQQGHKNESAVVASATKILSDSVSDLLCYKKLKDYFPLTHSEYSKIFNLSERKLSEMYRSEEALDDMVQVMGLYEVYDKGLKMYGSEKACLSQLRGQLLLKTGYPPVKYIELLSSTEGISLLLETLDQIDSGTYI